MQAYTDVVRSVWVEGGKGDIKVGPDGDGLGCVWLRTDGSGATYFGKVDLVLNPELARAVGAALIAAADEAESK